MGIRREAAKTKADTIGPQGWGRLGKQSYLLKPILLMTFRARSATENKAGGKGVASLKREKIGHGPFIPKAGGQAALNMRPKI